MKTRHRVVRIALAAILVTAATAAADVPTAVTNASSECRPGVCAPIDLRTDAFPDDFLARWPTFPATSYDAAFGGLAGAWPFVRERLRHIDSSRASGLYDGTEQWNETRVSPDGTPGVVTVTRVRTSVAAVYLPMRDGGYAVLRFDAKTRAIDAKELYDSQGAALPVGDGDAAMFFAARPIRFAGGEHGRRGRDALADWARRSSVALSFERRPTDRPLECRRTSHAAFALRCDDGTTPEKAACPQCMTPDMIWGRTTRTTPR